MSSLLRNRIGVPGIISVVALVFAMAGGAYAAKKYVITSTSQIKPSVLKALKGQAGPAGAPGAPGAAGAKGDRGEVGANGTNGTNGTNGVDGSPWTAGGTLPGNATETGVWGAGFRAAGLYLDPISFQIPLEEAPKAVLVAAGASKPGCPGIEDGAPTAEPGTLCIYQTVETKGTAQATLKPTAAEEPGTGPSGTLVFVECTEDECSTFGVWAVTAE